MYASFRWHGNQDTKHIHQLQKFPCVLLLGFVFLVRTQHEIYPVNISHSAQDRIINYKSSVVQKLSRTHPHNKNLIPIEKQIPM